MKKLWNQMFILIRSHFLGWKLTFLSDPSPIMAFSCQPIRKPIIWLKLFDLSKLSNWFFVVVTWIFQNWYMDLSKLLHGLFKIDTWIWIGCYMDLLKNMDLSKLFHFSCPLPNKTKLTIALWNKSNGSYDIKDFRTLSLIMC